MRALTLFCFVLAAVAIAGAQQMGRPAIEYLSLKQECGLVLAGAQYRAALKPSTNQETKWKAIFQRYNDAQKDIAAKNSGDSDAANDAYMKGLERLYKSTADESISVATEPQKKRLEEITLQLLGVEAFTKEDLLTELKLMSSQKARIKEIMTEYATKSEDLSADFTKHAQAIADPKPGDEASNKLYQQQVADLTKQSNGDALALWKATHEKVMGVLTAEQRELYKGLLGKPISAKS